MKIYNGFNWLDLVLDIRPSPTMEERVPTNKLNAFACQNPNALCAPNSLYFYKQNRRPYCSKYLRERWLNDHNVCDGITSTLQTILSSLKLIMNISCRPFRRPEFRNKKQTSWKIISCTRHLHNFYVHTDLQWATTTTGTFYTTYAKSVYTKQNFISLNLVPL